MQCLGAKVAIGRENRAKYDDFAGCSATSRPAAPSSRLGQWHLARQAQQRLTGGPLFVVDDHLAANAVLRVDHQRPLKVAGEPVVDLVADHEDLRKAGVGEAESM